MIPIPSRPGLDASTAIVLQKADLLAAVLGAFEVQTTGTVMAEIRAGANGPVIAALISGTAHDIETEGAFGPGENSLLTLYQQGIIDALFTDDGPCLRHCRKENIPHFSAIMIPYLMWQRGSCDREAAYENFRTVQSRGRYADWVVEYASGMWGE